MADIYFPESIGNPDYPLQIDFEDTSISSQAEDGTVIARRKFTRSRDTFTVSWSKMPKANFDVLRNFVKNTINFGAKSFFWKNPETETVAGAVADIRKVRLKEIKDAKLVSLNYYAVTLVLQEV